MKRFCNFYERRSDKFQVTITHDVWDGDGAERTEGTITIDGKVKEWYVKSWFVNGEVVDGRHEITIVIDGKEVPLSSYWKDGTPMNPADEILDALGTRHCPDTSDGRYDCPVCRGKSDDTIDEVERASQALLAADISSLFWFPVKTSADWYAYRKVERRRRQELAEFIKNLPPLETEDDAFALTQTMAYQNEVGWLTARFIENPELMVTRDEVPHQFSGAWSDAVANAERHLENQKAP